MCITVSGYKLKYIDKQFISFIFDGLIYVSCVLKSSSRGKSIKVNDPEKLNSMIK